MKLNRFQYSLLTVSIATFMGLNTASAATATAVSAPTAAINNKATASYSISTVAQPVVESNTVTVNVTETANFSLVSLIVDNDSDPDTAINQTATPGGTTTFTHALTNTGNVTDTYTVNTTSLNDPNITTSTPDYPLGTSNTIAYTIVQNDGNALTPAQVTALPTGQNQTGTLANGGTIKLPSTYRANLSYAASTPSTRNGNDKGVGTLTATSTFFTTAKATKPTLVNENQTIIRLPTFKIEKTATCGSPSTTCTTLDLNSTTAQITYSIKVTNVNTTYSDTATNFIIRDVLPAGMTTVGPIPTGVTSTTINNIQTLSKTITSLAAGESDTITFTVNVAKTSYTAANSSATNHATVYDRFNATLPVPGTDTTGYDIVDSTDTVAANNITRVPASADVSNGPGEDTTTTIRFTNRLIILNNPTTKEIAPTSATAGQITHQTNIFNNGQDVEGTDTNPLTFTITDGGNNTAVSTVTGPVNITYTPPNNGTPVTTTLQPTTTNGNTYIINSTTLPSGIAKGGTAAINYNITSTDAVIGSSETSIVALMASGNGAPIVPSVTDTTNVKGLTVLKQAALQVGCTGTAPAPASYEGILGSTPTITTFKAVPGDCIYYKITANNTFTNTGLTNVALSDLTNQWKTRSTYQSGTSTTGSIVSVTGTGETEAVTTTLGSIAGGNSASMTFIIKVNPQ